MEVIRYQHFAFYNLVSALGRPGVSQRCLCAWHPCFLAGAREGNTRVRNSPARRNEYFVRMLLRRKWTGRASQHTDAGLSHTVNLALLDVTMDLIQEAKDFPSKFVFNMKLGLGPPSKRELQCGSSENKGVPGNGSWDRVLLRELNSWHLHTGSH